MESGAPDGAMLADGNAVARVAQSLGVNDPSGNAGVPACGPDGPGCPCDAGALNEPCGPNGPGCPCDTGALNGPCGAGGTY